MDETAKMYKAVRDATVCNDQVSLSEKIATMVVIQQELVREVEIKMNSCKPKRG